MGGRRSVAQRFKPWTGNLPTAENPMRLGPATAEVAEEWELGADESRKIIRLRWGDTAPVKVTGFDDERHLRQVLGKLRGTLREVDRT